MDIEHGQVSIMLQDNIIVVKLTGAFNEHGAKHYTDGVRKCVDGFNGKPFSILIDNLALLGGTPEAYEELEKYNSWLNRQNMVAKAMLINSKVALDLMNTLSPSRKLQNSQNFTNEQDAIAWIKSQ